MKIRLPVAGCRLPVARRNQSAGKTFNLQPSTFNLRRGFTLMELLVVISILGLLAALTVPALKNIGQSQVQVSAARQLLDDVGRARQLAISQRTTVYMIFVPQVANWWNFLSASQLSAGTNLLDKQCRSYGFVTLRSVGDQPGQGVPRYLAEWKSLPDGAFIATNKFNHYYQYNPSVSYPNNDYLVTDSASSMNYPINSFNYYTNNNTLLPFPTETNFIYTSTFPYFTLPYIAFNYLGQLTVDGTTMALHDEFIPLAQGNVVYAMDAKKNLQPADADFTENPPGNSTNSMFNLVCIDRLTGRATLRQQKIQ